MAFPDNQSIQSPSVFPQDLTQTFSSYPPYLDEPRFSSAQPEGLQCSLASWQRLQSTVNRPAAKINPWTSLAFGAAAVVTSFTVWLEGDGFLKIEVPRGSVGTKLFETLRQLPSVAQENTSFEASLGEIGETNPKPVRVVARGGKWIVEAKGVPLGILQTGSIPSDFVIAPLCGTPVANPAFTETVIPADEIVVEEWVGQDGIGSRAKFDSVKIKFPGCDELNLKLRESGRGGAYSVESVEMKIAGQWVKIGSYHPTRLFNSGEARLTINTGTSSYIFRFGFSSAHSIRVTPFEIKIITGSRSFPLRSPPLERGFASSEVLVRYPELFLRGVSQWPRQGFALRELKVEWGKLSRVLTQRAFGGPVSFEGRVGSLAFAFHVLGKGLRYFHVMNTAHLEFVDSTALIVMGAFNPVSLLALGLSFPVIGVGSIMGPPLASAVGHKKGIQTLKEDHLGYELSPEGGAFIAGSLLMLWRGRAILASSQAVYQSIGAASYSAELALRRAAPAVASASATPLALIGATLGLGMFIFMTTQLSSEMQSSVLEGLKREPKF